MTIASETSSAGPYAGDDSTDNFSFAFKSFDQNDIAVVLTSSAGVDTTLTITTHYTVSLNADQEASPGGSVTLLTPPATGENLTILRDMTLTQGAALPNQGGWYPEVVEDALDKLTMIVQQQEEKISRALLAGVTSNPADYLSDVEDSASQAAASQAAAAASAAAALASEVAALASENAAAASAASVGFNATSTTEFTNKTINLASNTLTGTKAQFNTACTDSNFIFPGDLLINVMDYGATGDGSTNDTAAIQSAIDACEAAGGGTVYFPEGQYLINSKLTVDSNNVSLVGANRDATSIFSTTAGHILVEFSGVSRGGIRDMTIYCNKFVSTSTVYMLHVLNGVQCYFERIKVQGGYHCVALLGNACADNTFINCVFTYATGTALVYAARSTAGVNGAHHFYRCVMNQAYPVSTPVAASYKGGWASTTAYVAGDIVSTANYYLQCQTGGTSAGSAPTVNAFYGTGITDGTVTWQLMGRTAFNGFRMDTGTYYITLRECDLTGPYSWAIQIDNTLAGTAPSNLHVEQCTAHGPISGGIFVNAGRDHDIKSFESWNPTGSGTTYGIFVASGIENVLISHATIFKFSRGLYIAGTRVILTASTLVGHTYSGIEVAAGTTRFIILGNILGATTNWSNNANAVVVAAGASDYYQIAMNQIVGATSGITDGGTGVNKVLTGNY